jgi:hypothetical protein
LKGVPRNKVSEQQESHHPTGTGDTPEKAEKQDASDTEKDESCAMASEEDSDQLRKLPRIFF